MNWNLLQFFQEKDGQYSNMRLMNFLIPSTILFNLIYLTVKMQAWQIIDPISAAVIFFALGMKYAQKRVENGNGKQPEKKV